MEARETEPRQKSGDDQGNLVVSDIGTIRRCGYRKPPGPLLTSTTPSSSSPSSIGVAISERHDLGNASAVAQARLTRITSLASALQHRAGLSLAVALRHRAQLLALSIPEQSHYNHLEMAWGVAVNKERTRS